MDSPIYVYQIDQDLPLPHRAHPTDAGIDLYCAADIILEPGERALAPTGIAVAIPAGKVGLVHPRSGLAHKKGLSIVNAPGTIDADYRGEILVNLINLDPKERIEIDRAERIAQLIIQDVSLCPVEAVASLEELGDTARGSSGHGSTGTA